MLPGGPGRLGNSYLIDVPASWNGTLWLYSHGTIVAPSRRSIVSVTPTDAPDPGTRKWLLDHGYALAGSAYARPTGWAVEDALSGQLQLLDAFTHRIGRPKRVIAWGDSQGGLDTALLLERHPDRFAAGLSVCGLLGGGIDYFNHDLDMFFTLDVLLGPGSLIHNGAPTAAGIDSVPASGLIDQAQDSPTGLARLALAAALQAFPPRFNPADTVPTTPEAYEVGQVEWIRYQLGTSLRQDVESKAGGNPSWNTGVDYTAMLDASPYADEVRELYASAGVSLDADLGRLAVAPRISANPLAVEYMTEYGQPTGELNLPLLTIHTTDDGRVIAGNERAYADLVSRRDQPQFLRQLYVARGGHCAFSDAEMIAAIQTLTQRLDSGRWPDLEATAMNKRASGLGAALATSAPLGYRISDSGRFMDFTPSPLPR